MREAIKPAGGYRLIRSGQLVEAWRRYRDGEIRLVDLRVYLACHEVLTRLAGSFNILEVSRITPVSRPAASLRRLEEAGLLRFDEDGLALTAGQGEHVPFPRRILRWLAEKGRGSLIATAFGHLIRCLKLRKGVCRSGGLIKAAEMATFLGVDLRAFKAARAEMIRIGWLIPQQVRQQWRLNRYGAHLDVNLGWDRHPPAPDRHPLDLEPDPSGGREKPDPQDTGVCIHDVKEEDLKDTTRTLELHAQAVARGLVSASEADRLRVVAAAEHARAVGKTNPCGLFIRILMNKLYRYITQDDEDRAVRRLKHHLFPKQDVARVRLQGPRMSDDERLVREVKAIALQHGHKGDPFYLLRKEGWTRDRWDAAWNVSP